MSLKNPVDRWGPVSQFLHWTVLVLVLIMAGIGLSLDSVPKSPRYFWVFNLHKSLGLTVLALVLVRLAWRAFACAPEALAAPHRRYHPLAAVRADPGDAAVGLAV